MSLLPIYRAAAVLATTGFAFGSLSLSTVSVPMLLSLPTNQQRAAWNVLYDKAAPLQAGLAFIGAAAAGAVAWQVKANKAWPWALVAALDLAIPVYTIGLMAPLANNKLKGPVSDDEVGGLVKLWAELHLVRTALSLGATAILFGRYLYKHMK